MKEEVEAQKNSEHANKEACTEEKKQAWGRHLQLKEKQALKGVHTYSALDTHTGEQTEWVEIKDFPTQKAREEALERVKLFQTSGDASRLPKVLECFAKETSVVIITEARGGVPLARLLEETGPLPDSLVKIFSKDVLSTVQWMERTQKRAPIDMENTHVSAKGRVYAHSCLVWREIAGGQLSAEESSSEQRVQEMGMLLLSFSAGESLSSLGALYSSPGTLSDEEKTSLQKKIAEHIVQAGSTCFREVVIMALSREHTPYLVGEIEAHHFFRVDGAAETRCECEEIAETPGDQEDMQYEEELLSKASTQTESVYDKQGGVSVRASTIDKNKFAFQMHFFSSSKRVAFEFDKKEDTVESVVKEMKEEGFAEEKQIEVIKAHMENLIEKIEDKEKEESLLLEMEMGKEMGKGESAEKEKEKDTSTPSTPSTHSRSEVEIPRSFEKEVFLQKDFCESLQSTPSAECSAELGSVHAKDQSTSEESMEYPMMEYKDNYSVHEFVQEVAHYIKRTKSAAESWHTLLKKNDLRKVEDLKMLVEEDWESLKLPVFASRAMKNTLYGESSVPFKESMLRVDETMKEYTDNSTVEELLTDVVQVYGRQDMFADWLNKIQCQDIRTVGELKLLREEDWEHIGLSVYSYRIIKNAVFRQRKCVLANPFC
ncbi:WNK lysine deficient protein kinase [Nematocida sp. AWRm77]|nr:WNK lysine deficient protein kinase [Nematocida sp. AWRm77]